MYRIWLFVACVLLQTSTLFPSMKIKKFRQFNENSAEDLVERMHLFCFVMCFVSEGLKIQ